VLKNCSERGFAFRSPCVRYRLLLAAIVSLVSAVAYSAEYIDDEATAPESATEISSSMDAILDEEKERYTPFWRFERGGPFWQDSRVRYNLRGYDFERENEFVTLSEASAMGGELNFRSGRWRDRLSVEASWYASFGINAPADKDGTGLLGKGQSDLSVIGKAFVELSFGERRLRLYRQDFNIPYINRNDSRMIPNTHEAYAFAGGAGEKIEFIAAHVTRIKKRDSEDFITMAEAAGVTGGSGGTSVAGIRYSPTENFDVGGMTAYTRNVFNIFYAETNWRRTVNDNWGMQVSGQYTDQESVGRDRAGEFSTDTWGVRTASSYRNGILTIAYTDTDQAAAIRSPFGGRPGYSDLMLLEFDRAGENALRLSLSYHFGQIGVPGLSFKFSTAKGRDALDPVTGLGLGDARESDWTIDYRPEQGKFAGLWLRLRTADSNIASPSGDRRDIRLILNYTITMF